MRPILTAQFDDLVRQVSDTALLSMAAEASRLRELAEARPVTEAEPKELLFGLPGILAWRVAQTLAGAAQGLADARQPESMEAGFDEEVDLYQALWQRSMPTGLLTCRSARRCKASPSKPFCLIHLQGTWKRGESMKTAMADVIRNELEEFTERRDLAGSMMSSVLDEFDQLSGMAGVNFGTPPFLVLDGDDVMGVLKGDGEFKPCPYCFELDEDIIDDDRFDAVYNVLGPSGSLFRLVPVRTEFEPPDLDSGSFFETEYTGIPKELWEGFDLAAKEVHKLIEQRLDPAIVRQVASVYDKLAMLAADPENEDPESLTATALLVQAMTGRQLMRVVLAAYMVAIREIDTAINQESEAEDGTEEDS